VLRIARHHNQTVDAGGGREPGVVGMPFALRQGLAPCVRHCPIDGKNSACERVEYGLGPGRDLRRDAGLL
jgi:hypothetical protein